MTIKNFRTINIHDVYANSEPRLDLYVYSTAHNPKGATTGTDGRYIGTAESYGTAHDIWDAAKATAQVLYGSQGHLQIGLCVDADAYLKTSCKRLLDVQQSRKAGFLSTDLLDRWEAEAINQIRHAMGVAA